MARKKKTAAKKTAVRSVSFDAPQSRNEAILQNILGANNVLVDPQSRNEAILQAILNGTSYTEEPQSRIEELLICILNGTTTDMVPQSRNEEILIAKIKGEEYTADPQSRIEELLIQWLRSTPSYVIKTVTGNPVNVTNALATNAEGLSVALEPIQDLNGYDSPWPAGGGKNKFDYDSAVDGYLNASGMEVASPDAGNMTSDFIPVTAGQSYIYKCYPNETGSLDPWTGFAFYASKDMSSVIGSRSVYPGNTVPFTAPTGANYVRIGSRYLNGGSASFEEGSTVSPWTPYSNICPITGHDSVSVVRTDGNGDNAKTITIPLGDTIYGGTLDVVNGVLTVDRAMVELEDLDWSDSTSTRYISKTVTGMMPVPSSTTLPNVIAEQYRVVQWSDGLANNHDGIAVSNDNNARLYLYKDADTQSPTGKIVYELATPITISLTPQQLALLQGDNVITSDGEITLTYKAQS